MRGNAERRSITWVVFLAMTTISLVALTRNRGLAAPAANPVPGGGSAQSDCYIEFDVKGASTGAKNKFSCLDGDPACDATPSVGGSCDDTCSFSVALCPNQSGLTKCTPKPPLAGPPVVSGKGVTANTLDTALDLAGTDCGEFRTVPVPVKTKRGRKKPGKLTIHVKATISSGKPKNDPDTLILTCMPRTTGTCPATTTTTTSTTTTTTGTTCPPATGTKLSFPPAIGTTSCGPAGLLTPPAPPLSGELDSDTSCSTKVADLGLGCLCFGGGSATVVACGKIPDGAASLLDISGPGTLAGSTGNSANDCTKGAGPGKHCVNNNSVPTCTVDGDCGGAPGSCALDANCFFGPPLPIPSPAPFQALTTCVLNAVQTDASGTFDLNTGSSSVSLPLSSRVYITANP